MLPIRDTVPGRYTPVATWTLIAVNAVVFAFELTLPPDELEWLIHLFGVVPARYMHPGWAAAVPFAVADCWPVFTSMFFHGGWLHLIGNMWTLWIFGDNVEDRMGSGRFTVFYLLCGLVAAVAHALLNADSTVPTVGASGAIAGVMGAYFVLFPRSRIVVLVPILFVPLFVELPAVTTLGVWGLTQVVGGTMSLFQPGLVGRIAWWAHASGFAAGILAQYAFVRRDDGEPYRDEHGVETAWPPPGYGIVEELPVRRAGSGTRPRPRA